MQVSTSMRPRPLPARERLDMQEPQARHLVIFAYDEDRAGGRAVQFGDPALLAGTAFEFSHDVGDQCLIGRVPAIFLGIENGLAVHHPAQIAGLWRPQYISAGAALGSGDSRRISACM